MDNEPEHNGFISRLDFKSMPGSLGVPICYFGPVAMVTCDFLAIMFTQGKSPFQTSISGYAAGPFGFLEKLGIMFVSFSFALIGFNLLGTPRIPRRHAKIFSGILYLLVAAGFLLVSVFNVDTDASATFRGTLHMFAALSVTLLFPLACTVLFFALSKNAALRPLALYSVVTGLVGFSAALWIIFPANRDNLMGLSERLLAGINLLWMAIAGPRLVRVCNGTDFRPLV